MDNEEKHDALVVGLGFGGLYSLYLLKQLGLDVKAVESGADVGGARSDVTSDTYRYSWDKDLLKTSPWEHNYLLQPELQSYFREIATKHDLYRHISFNSDLQSAHWDETTNTWRATTSDNKTYIVRYLITSLGITHKPYISNIPDLEKFTGQITHTSKWTDDISWEGKKIAVIGSGASGVQITSSLAPKAGSLTQFIRHAQYVLPAQYRKISSAEREVLNSKYERLWHEVFTSAVGFGFPEPNRPTFSVSPEDRDQIFQDLWDEGSGFRFLFGGFSDLVVDEAANKEAIKFIHKKIKSIVKDEGKAEVLTSGDWFARRPLTDDWYYERFNQPNVHAIDLKKTPIVKAIPQGLQTSDGKIHEFDLIVFATGFDATDGSYYRIDWQGRNGKTLEDHWLGQGGPRTHLGISTSSFPNLFFVNGPGVPFANNPPVTEIGAEFVRDIIAKSEKEGKGVVESSKEAEEKWLEICTNIGNATLFAKTGSWFFGENVPGRKHSPRFFFGGIARWRAAIAEVKEKGFEGFGFGEGGK
ncbi:Cyclohexanone 1,2-monooxygenase [Pseudocercospora fuligena]|uniref:Cyclohexanone 1,2-monooxygenase n=1 Tax=Pseudocercospora fuligena TaxID=685502 RepID=A0A8H6VHX9_9PEZI|nr:Cyclohexanone 1,2-monooxygenase [Pseudocercospora fuligena]